MRQVVAMTVPSRSLRRLHRLPSTTCRNRDESHQSKRISALGRRVGVRLLPVGVRPRRAGSVRSAGPRLSSQRAQRSLCSDVSELAPVVGRSDL
jgi:hypothetical protein